jgi:hypothetical protein
MSPREDFPVTLIFPPQAHPTQPYLALPCLKSWLAEHGFPDVELLDLSVESYDHFLSAGYLERAALRAKERVPLEDFEDRRGLAFEDMPAFRAAAETRASARALVGRVEGAKAVVRGEGFHDPERYLPATRTLEAALRVVSAAHHPTELSLHNFTMRHSIERSEEVLAATVDEAENPYIAYLRTEVLPRLVARRPRVVGLSVIYGSQLIPALTLGRMIREELPDCHVTSGGGFLAYIGQKLMRAPGIEECLDSLVEHEGERPLEQLCRALAEGTSLAAVDSLTWFDRSGPEVRTVTNLRGHPIDLHEAPTPDFDGLPLDRYFSETVVLPYDVNRGCYHSECTFCTLPTVIGPGFRTRRVSDMVDDLLALKGKYSCDHFYLVTDCMPPATMRELPRELIERDAGIYWSADAKIERRSYQDGGAERLYESGCRKLLFGFESATPRLLAMMEKGQTLDDVRFVSAACRDAGISVTWYAMVGFPSETPEEAEATLEFIEQAGDLVQEVSLQAFHLDEMSDVFHTPGRYGVRVLDDPRADLALYHDYEVESGMSQEEAAELYAEAKGRLRALLPMFRGENLVYFMQKSHYFLHLCRGVRPLEFSRACAERHEARLARGPEAGLAVADDLTLVELPFSHSEARRALASGLAQAQRPEDRTGTFDAGAAAQAARRLGPLRREPRVLVYAADEAEFVELRPDGARALEALREAGGLGDLREAIDAATPAGREARAALDSFAGELHRLGVLRPR